MDNDGSIRTKQQFLAQEKSADVTAEQINNEEVTVRHYGNHVTVRPFSRRGRFTNVWLNQNGKWECTASQATLLAH